MLAKIIRHVKSFEKAKCMCFLIEDGELLKTKIKYGVKLAVYCIKDLIANQCIMK